jgi:hypothetical protein
VVLPKNKKRGHISRQTFSLTGFHADGDRFEPYRPFPWYVGRIHELLRAMPSKINGLKIIPGFFLQKSRERIDFYHFHL